MNGEQRIGKRAEQKRRWDRENRCVCSCGGTFWGHNGAERCVSCYAAERSARRDETYRKIESRWNEGESMLEIAAALGIAKGNLAAKLDRMRKAGWNVPYRYNVGAKSGVT